MRILYLSDSYLPSKKANSVHVMKMCEAFTDLGHDTRLVGLRSDGISDGSIIESYNVHDELDLSLTNIKPFKGVLFFHAVLNIFRCIKFQPDLVFGRSYFSICLISLFYKRCLLFEMHSPIKSLKVLQRWCFLRIIKKADGIIVISEALKKILLIELETRGILNKNIYVHHDGATIPNGPPSCDRVEGGRLGIAYIGSINKGRGIELILKLAEVIPEHDFHIVGGDLLDLQKKISIKNVPKNVILHGYLSQKKINELVLKINVFLAPYQYQTFVGRGTNTADYMSPLKIFEYMAYKKPIIVSNLPVIKEVLNDDMALLIDPEDLNEWRMSVKQLESLEKRECISNAAHKYLKDNYTWKIRAEKILRNISK